MARVADEDVRDQSAELRRYLSTAKELVFRRRYSQALTLIDRVLDTHEQRRDDPAALVEELRTLRGAIDAERRLFRHRVAMIAAFIGCVIAVGLLFFIPVSSTAVVVELRARSVTLMLAQAGSLSANAVESVHVNSPYAFTTTIRDVVITASPPAGLEAVAQRAVIPNAQLPVVIRGSRLDVTGSALSVPRLNLQPNVLTEINASGDANTTVTIEHRAATSGELHTGESVMLECDDCELVQAQTNLVRRGATFSVRPFPRRATLQGTGAFSRISLVLPANAQSASTAGGLRVASIDFTENAADGLRSSIIDGALRLVDMNDRLVPLSRGDFLALERAEDLAEALVLVELTLGRELSLRLRGRVSSVASGADRDMHSRTPSLIEWIAANEPRALFVVTVAAVFGFLMAAAARLRIGQIE